MSLVFIATGAASLALFGINALLDQRSPFAAARSGSVDKAFRARHRPSSEKSLPANRLH